MADNMLPVTIDGRPGTAVYLTADLKLTTSDKAALVKVVFDDGGRMFLVVGAK